MCDIFLHNDKFGKPPYGVLSRLESRSAYLFIILSFAFGSAISVKAPTLLDRLKRVGSSIVALKQSAVCPGCKNTRDIPAGWRDDCGRNLLPK
jgi:hypothetical protein